MAHPATPHHAGYAVILAAVTPSGVKVEQADYADAAKAHATYYAVRAEAIRMKAAGEPTATLSITLEGPGDVVLAEWEG